jgi:hypothetical protein
VHCARYKFDLCPISIKSGMSILNMSSWLHFSQVQWCQLLIYYVCRFYDKQLMGTQGVNSEAWNILVKIKVNLGLTTHNIFSIQVL